MLWYEGLVPRFYLQDMCSLVHISVCWTIPCKQILHGTECRFGNMSKKHLLSLFLYMQIKDGTQMSNIILYKDDQTI